MPATVLLTFSDSFALPGLVAAASVAEHVPTSVPIVIASTDLAPSSRTRIGSAFAGREVDFVDAGPIVAGLPGVSRYVPDTWIRMFVDDVVPTGIDRVVYLDADTLTVDSLEPLFTLDLGGHPLAALEDPVFVDFAGRGSSYVAATGSPGATRYFNTGVLVIDRIRWRRLDVATRARRLVREGRIPIDFVDQDALNAVLGGDWLALDPRWHRLVGPEEGGVEGAAVLHFTGSPKPWQATANDPSPAHRAYRRAAEALGWAW